MKLHKTILLIIIAALVIGCTFQGTESTADNTSIKSSKSIDGNAAEKIVDSICEKEEMTKADSIVEQRKKHLAKYKIVPAIVVNNPFDSTSVFQLGNHSIKWIDSESETKIQINDDVFSLKEEITLNVVSHKQDSVDFVNTWDTIKLFKVRDREIIGIQMSYNPCSAIGCSVNYFLLYDIFSKSKSYFGTYRIGYELEIFDFVNDDRIDFIAHTFNGDSHGSTPMEFISELYSMDSNGRFKECADENGKVFYLKTKTFPKELSRPFEFEENWIMAIE